MILLYLLLSCQGPLGDRHTITEDRILAVVASPSTENGEVVVQPRALLATSGALWSDELATFRWHWVPGDDDAVARLSLGDSADGVGPTPLLRVPEDDRRLALLVSMDDGQILRSFLDLPEPTHVKLALDNVVIERVTDTNLATIEADTIAVDQRSGWETEPTQIVEPGDILRFSAISSAPNVRTRWTATAPFGTFLELSPLVTDWIAGSIVVDDDILESREALQAGVLSVVALLLDDAGGVAYRVLDINVGEAGPGFGSDGRWIETDVHIEDDYSLVKGTVTRDDATTSGIRLTDAAGVSSEALPSEDPYGTNSLQCAASLDTPFHVNWLAEQRCSRSDIAGKTIVMEKN